MAHTVSNEFRKRAYSGSSIYTPLLKINSSLISKSQVQSILVKDSVIDTTSSTFYLGTFIGKQIEIQFLNKDNLNINSGDEVELEIGQYIDKNNTEYQYTESQHNAGYIDGYEYVYIGKFLVDDIGEDYQKNNKLTCTDKSVLFKVNIDYSPCFKDGKATIEQILQYICDYVNVPLGLYSEINKDLEIGSYDSRISGKQWISYIAEIMGCNAKIVGDELIFIPLSGQADITINAKKGASFVLGEKFRISKVVYDNGVLPPYAKSGDTENEIYLTTESGEIIETELITENEETNSYDLQIDSPDNVLYLRQDNPFIINQSVVDNIFDSVYGFEIYNLEVENYGDISLECYDLVNYSLDNKTYQTFYQGDYTYEMTIMKKLNVSVPTKLREDTTNAVEVNDNNLYRYVKGEIDSVNNQYVLKATDKGKIALVKIGANADTGSTFNVVADNIELEGYTSINRNFKVDEEGNLIANKATLKDMFIDGGNILLYSSYGEDNVPSIEIKSEDNPNHIAKLYGNDLFIGIPGTYGARIGYAIMSDGSITNDYQEFGSYLNEQTTNGTNSLETYLSPFGTQCKKVNYNNLKNESNLTSSTLTMSNDDTDIIYLNSNDGSIKLKNNSGNTIVSIRNYNNHGEIDLTNADGTTNIILGASDGWITCTGLTQTSLEKDKKGFEKYNDALKEILNTDIYKYNFKTDLENKKKHIGFVIGKNYNYSKDITATNKDNEEIGVDVYSMVSVLWQGVKEQQAIINDLENKLNLLENKINGIIK